MTVIMAQQTVASWGYAADQICMVGSCAGTVRDGTQIAPVAPPTSVANVQ